MIQTRKQRTRTLPTVLAVVFLFITIFLLFLHFSPKSDAANPQLFNYGNIMSDFVMTNKSSLSEEQIRTFLKSKNACNDSNLSKLSGYNATQGWLNTTLSDGTPITYYYNLKDGRFVCLANESFNGEDAARIIWQAAQDYNVNPQVLIVLLQKEQSLITDSWPNNIQYRSATGYGCPDTEDCNAQYYGFKNQVRNAANFFRAYQTGNTGWYKLVWPGNKYTGAWQPFYYDVRLHPNASCGAVSTFIANRATASLYSYTPYRPTQAALNAGYGSVAAGHPERSCSSYGNRNFWLYFTDWFGSTQGYTIHETILAKYNQVGNLGSTTMSTVCGIRNNGCYHHFDNGSIYWSASTGAWRIGGGIKEYWNKQKAEWGRLGYPTSDEMYFPGGAKQNFEGGTVYWLGNNNKVLDINNEAVKNRYEQNQNLGTSPMSTYCGIRDGGCYQHFSNGSIYWSSASGAQRIGGGIKSQWDKQGSEWGRLGYPTTGEIYTTSETKQEFQGGTIYWTPTGTRTEYR